MKPLTPEKAQKLIDTIRALHTPDELLNVQGAPDQQPHSGALGVDGGSAPSFEALVATTLMGRDWHKLSHNERPIVATLQSRGYLSPCEGGFVGLPYASPNK